MIRNAVFLDFPDGLEVKNPPANTGPLVAAGQQSPGATTAEARLHFLEATRSRSCGLREEPLQRDALTPPESSPCSPRREKATMHSNADPAQPKRNEQLSFKNLWDRPQTLPRGGEGWSVTACWQGVIREK